ncbi:MAG: alpha-N-acetylglucosaminidase, partial [Tannerellaceae bacterium]
WDWARWEQEIDWMALHGIDMPLTLVAYEAIIARVWEQMGLTKEEINSYFVGPAHLPWMRMGNISGIDGPLTDEWHEGQIKLQHKILTRMRELGMKPICPGFPGFVPPAFKRVHPELELIQTHWGGAFHNWMISPQEPLFSEIGTAFIKEWEKEFGENDRYLVDSFNEMEIPFPEKGTKERYELVASYGDKVYQSIKKGNPDAIWVMQGWMFGYQRHIWDYETLQALVSKVPDDKMLLLDLAVDYNKHFWNSEVNWEFYKGFYNKPWVYSLIPNMGGKTGFTGVLDFYANGHLEALRSPNKGRLVAHGLAPEGIENNEIIYELYADAGWNNEEMDLDQWLKNYSQNRYGGYPQEIANCWSELQKSVYGTFTDHPRYNWQFRPGSVTNGSINLDSTFFIGLESFAKASAQMKDSPLYKVDLAEFTALYLGGKAELLVKLIDQSYLNRDTISAIKYEKDFEYLMLGLDRLLSVHPTLNLERWIEFARNQGATPELKAKYESNAKRIVTIWGPPVDDYSARVWSGLVRDYYLPRWQHYFSSRKNNTRFDFATWERDWVEQSKGLSVVEKPTDIVKTADELISFASQITPELLQVGNEKRVGVWSLKGNADEEFVFTIPARKLAKLKGIQIGRLNGVGKATVLRVAIEVDGVVGFESAIKRPIASDQPFATYSVELPEGVKANNSCELKVSLKGSDLSGDILFIDK